MANRVPQFAGRLNSFAVAPDLYWQPGRGKLTTRDLLERAAQVPELDSIDLNYPDHLQTLSLSDLRSVLDETQLSLNGFAMRYYSEPAYTLGAFTNPDPKIRAKAIDLTRQAIDDLAELGGNLLTIWPGQDGFAYSFQVDYQRLWEQEVYALQQVANHNPNVQISIEYKPDEPRPFSLLGDIGTTLLAIKETGLPNLGVTLDVCHVMYAGEQPAYAAMLAAHHSRILGLHLNDGYGRRDDGLMIGSVHLVQILELLYHLVVRMGYDGVIYFDTFPEHEDPIAECSTNIAAVKGMLALLDKIDQDELEKIFNKHGAVEAQKMVLQLLMPALQA